MMVFCWKHFLFPLHHVAEIHRLHQFSMIFFVHFLCNDFIQHSTVQICLPKERSMKPLASWELAIKKKKSFQKRVTFWSWWFSQLPRWSRWNMFLVSLGGRKPNETKLPAMTSEKHLGPLDKWMAAMFIQPENHLVKLVKPWSGKRCCRYLLGGVLPAKFNIDIHNLPYFQRRYMFQNHHFWYPFEQK